ncbi:sensor histidine kinase [Vibrio maritimus]|uniref:histidine kinase n=1 Tax=Vibrio maritimus TaxID=990268 RepID=A0A090T9T7_9VIBR|nr:sensor histidine kinase [Vibrio maritimus]
MTRRILTKKRVETLYQMAIVLSALWLVISVSHSRVSDTYQQVYLALSHQITQSLEDIYTFDYNNEQTYDNFSNELVAIELEAASLYNNLLENQQRYLPFISPIPEQGVQFGHHIKTQVLNFTQRLERLLSAKVSYEYSGSTLKELQRGLLSASTSDTDKLQLYQYFDNQIARQALTTDAQTNNTILAIDSYIRLNSRVKNEIDQEKQALLGSEIHTLLNDVNTYWMTRTSNLQGHVIFSGVLLFVFLGGYIYWRQWIQQYREAKLNRELFTKEKERSHLALVVEHASDAIIITDKDGFVTWANTAFERLSGYQVNEVLGLKPGSFLQGEETSKQEVDKISTHLKKGEPVQSELINYHKDGTPYWIDIAITPIRNYQQEVEQFIAVERDSSVRKSLERDLRLAVDSADASNKAKSTFLATMSHELRTPLNGILGMAQILESSVTKTQHKEQLNILLESGNHLLSLLNDILDISKIEEGKLELEAVDFAISDLCSPIVTTYSSICTEKGVEFVLDNQLENGKCYRGDKSRIRQVIFNLLGNAVKFTRDGKVTLTLSSTPTENGKDEIFTISVKDTGVGIPSERLGTIFDPFTQAEASTTRKFGGTGLGLAIVKKLANIMNGDASVTSEPGVGSEFVVTMQLSPAEAVKKQQKAHVSLDDQALAQSLNILLVEDNKVNALVAKTFCTKQGHKVEVAVNGQEAVEKVKQGHYDLIIMDNHMPVMDGIEATRIIREELHSKTVIFGCTADVFKEAHDNFIAAGANHILTKPLQKESFIDALQQYRHLLVMPPKHESNNKVVELIRHDLSQISISNTTEAELKVSPSNGKSLLSEDRIKQFKQTSEDALTTLITSYSSKDKATLSSTLNLIHNECNATGLSRMVEKTRSLETTLDGDIWPALEEMQSLVNLLEVNIHEAVRILDKYRDTQNQSVLKSSKLSR